MSTQLPLQRIPTEEALKQREKELSALLNASHDLAYLMRPDGTLLTVNQNYFRAFGRKAAELVGTCCFDLLPPAVAEVRRQLVEQLVTSGRTMRFEDQVEDRFFEHSFYPVFGDEQEVEKVASSPGKSPSSARPSRRCARASSAIGCSRITPRTSSGPRIWPST